MLNTLKSRPAFRMSSLLALCLGVAATYCFATAADGERVIEGEISACNNVITFDTQQEYEAYVTTNNDEHDYGGSHPVERFTGLEPNRPGVLRMQNLRDVGPASATRGYVIPARAMVTFDGSLPLCPGILIAFDYLFQSPGCALAVVVRCGDLEVTLPSVVSPNPGSPGSAGNAVWGRYTEQQHLADSQLGSSTGLITLELTGPACAQVMIDELTIVILSDSFWCLGPKRRSGSLFSGEGATISFRCVSHCADIAGVHPYSVGPEDYLAAVYCCHVGLLDESAFCLDGGFTADGAMSLEDVEYFDWVVSDPLISSCVTGLGVISASAQGTTSPLRASGCTPAAPLLVAGKAYALDPYEYAYCFLADRIFGFDTDGRAVGSPLTWGEDHLNTRLAKDHSGALYQLNVRKGIVRLSDAQSVLPRCCLPYEGNDVHVGWNSNTGAPPLQDLVFDDSGDVYVVPVLVIRPDGEKHRAAARIHLAATPDNNRVVQLYNEPLFASGVHEIGLDQDKHVFVLDKQFWVNSVLLCYDRDSGSLKGRRACEELLPGLMPSAFHVSPRDGRIFIVSRNDSLVQASSFDVNAVDTQRTEIQGMSYVSDITEEDDTGTIWLAGFSVESWPNAADVFNGATMFSEPGFKPMLARVLRGDAGPVEALAVSDYEIPGKEYLSLPLSIVCTSHGP